MEAFEDVPSAKASIVVVESLSMPTWVWGWHDLMTHSRAMLATVASRNFISRAFYAQTRHLCLMTVHHLWCAMNCSTSVSWLGSIRTLASHAMAICHRHDDSTALVC